MALQNLSLLKEVCELPGAPGFEQPIRSFVEKEVKGLVDVLNEDKINIKKLRVYLA